MHGHKTLWVPGTDHAGIATQNVVEKQLAEEGLTRHDLGREEFLERMWHGRSSTAARSSGSSAVSAPPATGSASASPWTRASRGRCARHSCSLYNEGLIYRGSYIINWCPRCRTDASPTWRWSTKRSRATLILSAIPWLDGAGDIVVATTRPETMLGDTAVAVHPDDARYRTHRQTGAACR